MAACDLLILSNREKTHRHDGPSSRISIELTSPFSFPLPFSFLSVLVLFVTLLTGLITAMCYRILTRLSTPLSLLVHHAYSPECRSSITRLLNHLSVLD